MEYQTFVAELRNYILQNKDWDIAEDDYRFYPDGYTSENLEDIIFIRNTNIKYHHTESDVLKGDFINLNANKRRDNSSYCRFSVSYLYDTYTKHGWDRIAYIIGENLRMATDNNIDEVVNRIKDYTFIKDRLIVRPINFTDNRYALKDCIYERVGDIALVLYILLYDDEERGLGTLKVQKGFTEEWDKEHSELWEEAMANTNVWAPPRIYMHAEDTINPPYTKGAFMAMNYKPEKIGALSAPVITTTKKQNGAIAMFYPGVPEKLAEICGGSYYIAFTSIHEFRIHPVGTMQPRQILYSLKNVNKEFNKPEDILSRKLYLYDHEKNALALVEM